MDFKSEFNDETLFLTPDILEECCMMNGKGASSSNWSSSKVNRSSEDESWLWLLIVPSALESKSLMISISIEEIPFATASEFPNFLVINIIAIALVVFAVHFFTLNFLDPFAFIHIFIASVPLPCCSHDTKLRWDYDRRCCGSCFGWLATVDKKFAVSLTNPFLGKTIKFPSVRECEFDYGEYYHLQITKVIVSKDPALFPNDYVVVAIHYPYLKFSCIKAGDKSWVEVDSNGLRPFSDVIFHNNVLYAVGMYGGVGSLDIIDTKFDGDFRSKLQVIIRKNKAIRAQITCLTYLVESSQGELLQIRRFLDCGDDKYKTCKFDIFKLSNDDGTEEEGKVKWIEVKSLGEDALFLGFNYSTSILTSNSLNCKSNCIYYTDNYDDNGYVRPSGSFDNGIYNVGDGSFTSHYIIPSSHKYLPPPLWIHQPNIV